MDSHVGRLSSFIGFPLKNLLGGRRIVLGKRRQEASINRMELSILSRLDKVRLIQATWIGTETELDQNIRQIHVV